jgi:drug/metabolite transporter (DMT)-like permease
MKLNNITAYLYLSSAMIIVSSSFPVGKMAVSKIPVFILSGSRYAVAMILMIPVLIFSWAKFKSITTKDFALLAVQAFFGVWIFNIFLFWGLKLIPSANSGIILGSVPAIILILSKFFYKEVLGVKKIIAVILAFISIWILQDPSSVYFNNSYDNWLGFGLVGIAALGEALFLFISKSTSSRVDPLVSASVISIFGLIMILPFSIWEYQFYSFTSMTDTDILIILYFGVIITFVGYVLWFKGTSLIPASESALFSAVMPISAVFLSSMILDEQLYTQHYISLFLIIIAIKTSITQNI